MNKMKNKYTFERVQPHMVGNQLTVVKTSYHLLQQCGCISINVNHRVYFSAQF